MSNSLDFEQPIVDLEAKIDELRRVDVDGALDLHREIERLETKSHKLTREIFASLDAWQITQLARPTKRRCVREFHPRPTLGMGTWIQRFSDRKSGPDHDPRFRFWSDRP